MTSRLALLAAVAAALTAALPAPGHALAPAVAPAPAQASATVTRLRLTIPDGDGPAIEGGVWLPVGAVPGARVPLVVISHGNGGSWTGHAATAEALARAGFMVAAISHTGDNYRDQSRATEVAERPRQLKRLIDYMLEAGAGGLQVDPERIGAFGFSSGGFTVLAAAGGRPDLTRVIDHCRANPGFHDCRLVAAQGASATAYDPEWTHDHRIRAVVAAAPALGYTFGREGLADVDAPVQLWRPSRDRVLPHPFYAQAVHDALPTPPEYHVVEGADHFDMMPPCSPELAAAAPVVCAPTPAFDRAAFQQAFNVEVAAFFTRTLTAR
ncbi:MAG: prolyl oligopeptidase family serine peptidase [Brevundimonas sp.]|uniref:alpha/beta hydrolase family protein n=1 Tax=Brevundimonas sp. TaxID=1871086 RepID=UPI0022C64203|nr:prolyl oligopeptidase family serine peptidase [Brevundimonas sp.]